MKDEHPNLSRRNFLRGKIGNCHSTPPAPPAAHRWVTFEASCMAQQGVICRTCGDHCDEQAITFPPQAGGLFPPQLISEKCTGCGGCLPDCPTQAIRFIPKNA